METNLSHHYLSLAKGVAEFCMVGSVHAVAPVYHSLGHYLGLLSFCLYAGIALTHIRHSAMTIKDLKSK